MAEFIPSCRPNYDLCKTLHSISCCAIS